MLCIFTMLSCSMLSSSIFLVIYPEFHLNNHWKNIFWHYSSYKGSMLQGCNDWWVTLIEIIIVIIIIHEFYAVPLQKIKYSEEGHQFESPPHSSPGFPVLLQDYRSFTTISDKISELFQDFPAFSASKKIKTMHDLTQKILLIEKFCNLMSCEHSGLT